MVQIISFIFIRFIPIFLLLFHYSYSSTVELIKEGSKYEKEEYIKFFEIPRFNGNRNKCCRIKEIIFSF